MADDLPENAEPMKKKTAARDQTAKVLQRDLARYRTLYDTVLVGLARTAIADGKLLECNHEYARMHGYASREEALSEHVASGAFVDPRRREEMLEQLKAHGAVDGFEAQVRRKDGSVIWVRCSPRLYEKEGCIEGVIIDITAQKEIEEALRQREQETRLFSEQLTILNAIGNELSQAASLDDLCRRAVELGRERMGFERLGIRLYDKANNCVAGMYGTDERGHTADERDRRRAELGGLEQALAQGKSRYIAKANVALHGSNNRFLGMGMRTVAGLWDGEELIGFISADNSLSSRPITESQNQILGLYGMTLGHLVTLKRSEDRTQLSNKALTGLHEVGNELSKIASLDDLCRRAVELGRERLGFERLGIRLYDKANDCVAGMYGTDEHGHTTDERDRRRTGLMELEQALAQGEARYIAKANVALHGSDDLSVGMGMRTVAGLWDGEKVIGFISANNSLSDRPITESQNQILGLYGITLGHLIIRKQRESDAHAFNERLTRLNEIVLELSQTASFDGLCRRAVELGRTLLGFDRLGIWFFDGDSETMTGSFGTDESGNIRDERGQRAPKWPHMEEALKKGRFHYACITDVDLPRTEGKAGGKGTRSQAALWDGKNVIGVIGMDNLLTHRPITEDDNQLLALYGMTLGHLFARQRTQAEVQKFNGRVRVLHEIGNELSRMASVDEMCRRAVELGREKLGFDRLGMWFYDRKTNTLDGAFGTDQDGNVRDERQVRNKRAVGDAIIQIVERKASFTALTDTVFYDPTGQKPIGRGSKSVAALWDGEEAIGYLSTDNLIKRQPITEHDNQILSLYAATLGHLMTRKRSEEQTYFLNEQLTRLHEVEVELSKAASFDDLCRQGVELGRERLGFDRLGIWFYDASKENMLGSFGTDERGATRDERGLRVPTWSHLEEILEKDKFRYVLRKGVNLHGERGQILGQGDSSSAALWDGKEIIGYIATDNLLSLVPITESKSQVLALYGMTLGHLFTRKRAEDQIRFANDKLTRLHEMGVELSKVASFEDLCRQGVELGRERLGFDRLGIWLYDGAKDAMAGTFGTDEQGNTCDERGMQTAVGRHFEEAKKRDRFYYTSVPDIDLRDGVGQTVGKGTFTTAALWDGQNAIGYLAMDNLLSQRPVTEGDGQLLALYGTTLGTLLTRKRGEVEASGFNERLRLLHEASNELSRVPSFDELCRRAVELGRETLGFDRVGIWFYDKKANCINGSFRIGDDGRVCDARDQRSRAVTSMGWKVLSTKERLEARSSVELYSADMTTPIRKGAKSIAALWDGAEVIGYIANDNLLSQLPITEQDNQILVLYAATLGHLFTRKRSEEEARHFNERLTLLHDIGNDLSRIPSFDDMCRRAVELGREKLGFDRMGLAFFDAKNNVVNGAFGTDEHGVTVDERPMEGVRLEGTTGWEVIHSKARLVALDDAPLFQWDDQGALVPIGRGMKSVAALWDGENAIGHISVDNLLRCRPLSGADNQILVLYASTLGHLVKRRLAEEETRRFNERLTRLHEVGIELSRIASFDDMCRRAIELGREKLGFDRLGLRFLTKTGDSIDGSFGTDEHGATRDERSVRGAKIPHAVIWELLRTKARIIAFNDFPLVVVREQGPVELGKGMRSVAALWDGESIIGYLSTDNLIQHRPITETDNQLLALYAEALGHLVKRRWAEEETRRFNERLTLLHEVSNELSGVPALDDLCRRAIELGREKLGFDRLGLWLYDTKANVAYGTFGTDEQGNIRDERHARGEFATSPYWKQFTQQKERCIVHADTAFDDPGKQGPVVVGRGARTTAALWDGEEVIGNLSTDNLIKRQPITNADNQILVLYAATLGHLVKRRRAEDERVRLEAQVQQAQKLESLGVLAGGIAHDFNNLLMAILGNADLALMEISPVSPARECIQEIETAARRAADLAKQMLAYSGKGKFVVRSINLNEVITEMAHLLEVSISKKAIIRQNLAANLPAVEADATQMRQIIMNLITNASEAIGDKSGYIAITTGAMQCDGAYLEGTWLNEKREPGRYVFIEVSDTGCGMDKDTVSKIFDPFFTTKFTGRGLGLAAVLGIVRGHKGALKVYSEPGKGTTFKVLLPAVGGSAASAEEKAPSAGRWRGTGTILLVDDEEAVRAVGKHMLERIGFTVLTATNGREAVDLFQERAAQIACVILDLTMPHMDGEETFREMRRIREDACVILSSGYNEQEVVNRFAGKGLAGFIQKPYQSASLAAKVREALEK